ncbi:hypothetical protein HWV23_01230 [Natronomonas halophila]|uniref:HalOD1 output domain-containing protein n=1 Tax=Natronomonas halophila TaxID=2747817 RepID=UPI0015B3FFBB|nr:HalOD1 output domain-containing protein [Natronomonas halophila]QLD84387.1 hypothetical protein HWV23_01230 [Natronomonas halophila]
MSTQHRVTIATIDEPLETVAERRYEPAETDRLVGTLVDAIVEAEGISDRDFLSPPLYDAIDVEALERTLFRDPEEFDSCQVDGFVRFQYLDYTVTVEGDGRITVYTTPANPDR